MVAAFAVALALVPTGAARAGERECIEARDRHADFKAILSSDPAGKPQYDTIKHGADGNVTVTRWVDGKQRSVRTLLGGIYTQKIQNIFGARTDEVAITRTIDLAKVLPPRPDTVLRYTMITTQAGTNSASADVTTSFGPRFEATMAGCALSAMEALVVTENKPPKPGTTLRMIFVPALGYALEVKGEVRTAGRTVTSATKVLAIEAWRE